MTQFDNTSRRQALFRLAALATAERLALAGQPGPVGAPAPQAHKVVLVTIGGIRRQPAYEFPPGVRS